MCWVQLLIDGSIGYNDYLEMLGLTMWVLYSKRQLMFLQLLVQLVWSVETLSTTKYHKHLLACYIMEYLKLNVHVPQWLMGRTVNDPLHARMIVIVLVNTQALDNDQLMVIYVQVQGACTVWSCLLQAILDQCHVSNCTATLRTTHRIYAMLWQWNEVLLFVSIEGLPCLATIWDHMVKRGKLIVDLCLKTSMLISWTTKSNRRGVRCTGDCEFVWYLFVPFLLGSPLSKRRTRIEQPSTS